MGEGGTTPLKEDITDTSLEELLRVLLHGKPFNMPDVAPLATLLLSLGMKGINVQSDCYSWIKIVLMSCPMVHFQKS